MKPNITILAGIALSWTLAGSALSQSLTFTTTNYPRGGEGTRGVAMADVNGDGKVDLICSDASLSQLSVLTNDGSGSFSLFETVPLPSGPGTVVPLDVNGDGKMDLICQYPLLNQLDVMTNDGTGAFDLEMTIQISSPLCITLLDVNGDGKADLITANPSGTLTILTNDGSGGFGLKTNFPTASFPLPVLAADINNDGKLDLLSLGQNNMGFPIVMIHTNNGSGVFGSNSVVNVSGSANWIATADVNGDGKVDLLVTDRSLNKLIVWTNNGSGVFGSNNIYSVGTGPLQMDIGDINGDGKPDVVVASDSYCIGSVQPCSDGTVTILTNNGSGTFHLSTTLTAGIVTGQVVPIDVNGDGKVDIIAVNQGLNYGPASVSEYINTSQFPAPKLGVASSVNHMVIQWPSSAVGFTLQTNSSPGSTNWVNYGGTVSDNGLVRSVSNSPLSNPKLFFRLKK